MPRGAGQAGHKWWHSEGRYERALALYNAGYSSRYIAHVLGTTRNAVLGKLWRGKLPAAHTP